MVHCITWTPFFLEQKSLTYLFACFFEILSTFSIYMKYKLQLQLKSVWCCKMCKHVPAPLTALENVQLCQHHYVEFRKRKLEKNPI